MQIYLQEYLTMTKEEYILIEAKNLKRSAKKRKKLLEKSYDTSSMTPRAIQKLHADMSWEGMHYAMTEERLGYALGRITLDELKDYYEPSGWHKYNGVKSEMEKLKFEK